MYKKKQYLLAFNFIENYRLNEKLKFSALNSQIQALNSINGKISERVSVGEKLEAIKTELQSFESSTEKEKVDVVWG